MHLKSLTYQTLEKGAFVGTLAFVVEVGESSHLPTPPSWVVGTIHEAREEVNDKRKHVRIRGGIHNLSPEEAFILVTALKNMGYVVSVEYHHTYYPSWISQASYRICLLSETEWSQTPCEELWYFPKEGSEEPKILSSSASNIPLYVDPGEGGLEGLFHFLSKAKLSWNVLVRSVAFKIKIRGEEVNDGNDLSSRGGVDNPSPPGPYPRKKGK